MATTALANTRSIQESKIMPGACMNTGSTFINISLVTLGKLVWAVKRTMSGRNEMWPEDFHVCFSCWTFGECLKLNLLNGFCVAKGTWIVYMNCELPDVQAGLRKGRGTRDQIANICRIIEKHLIYWLCQSLALCGSQQTEKFWKIREYQTTWPASWKSVCSLRSNSCNWTRNSRLVPNWGRSTSRLYTVILLI